MVAPAAGRPRRRFETDCGLENMRLFRHYSEVPAEARGAVVAIGNFDGVHLGHQAVLAETARLAAAQRAPLAVMTFEPHPRAYFQPNQPPFRLTPFRIKVRALEALGIEHLFVFHFDQEIASKSAEAFVIEVLSEGLDVAHVVIGYDFVFGRGRTGNAELIRELGAVHGFDVTSVAPKASAGGEVYSSTHIRRHLAAGRIREATALLGRPWEIEGRVEPGDKVGRSLGFPTANVALSDYTGLAHGIYAVKAGIDEGPGTQWRDGAAYVGPRPTLGGTQAHLEVHLLDFDGDLYGRHMRAAFVDFIRGDKAFDGLPALQAQIAEDCLAARRILAAYNGPAPGALPALRPASAPSREDGGFYQRALGPRSSMSEA
jgi:riboflavin kinase / FMN adenylyltransferase